LESIIEALLVQIEEMKAKITILEGKQEGSKKVEQD